MKRWLVVLGFCGLTAAGLMSAGCSDSGPKKEVGTRTYLPDSFRQQPQRKSSKHGLFDSRGSSSQYRAPGASSKPGFFESLFSPKKKPAAPSVPTEEEGSPSSSMKPGGIPLPEKTTGDPALK